MGGCAWPAIRRSERSIARTYSKCHVLSGPGASGRRQPDRVSTEKHSSGMHIFESHSLDDAPPRRVGRANFLPTNKRTCRCLQKRPTVVSRSTSHPKISAAYGVKDDKLSARTQTHAAALGRRQRGDAAGSARAALRFAKKFFFKKNLALILTLCRVSCEH
jgi:hypothetical protein